MQKRGIFVGVCIALCLLFLIAVMAYLPSSEAGKLKVTGEHPFLVDGSWKPASELKVGDKLKTADGKTARITAIRDIVSEKPFLVYNLEAGGFSNFIVCGEEKCNNESAGIMVHNSNALGYFECDACRLGPCFQMGECGGTVYPLPGVKVICDVWSDVKLNPLLRGEATAVGNRGHSKRIRTMVSILHQDGEPPRLKYLPATDGVLEAGSLQPNAARIFYKRIPPVYEKLEDGTQRLIKKGKITIVGYADKQNEQCVINQLRKLYPRK